jgi:hypothetical protein
LANESPTAEGRLADMIEAGDVNVGPCCHDDCEATRLSAEDRLRIVTALREAEGLYAERNRLGAAPVLTGGACPQPTSGGPSNPHAQARP